MTVMSYLGAIGAAQREAMEADERVIATYHLNPLDAAETLTAATQRMVDTLALLPDVAARQRAYAVLETILDARRRGPGGGDLPPLPPLGKAPMAAERQGRE